MRIGAAALVAVVLCVWAPPEGRAQMPFGVPAVAASTDGPTLFARQCGACHVATMDGSPHQGPTLFGVFGRKAGSVAGFAYSPNYASSGIVWDDTTLDRYLTNPQATIEGSVMAYRQADAEIRHTIIAWLKEQK